MTLTDPSPVTGALTSGEQDQLAAHEKVIARGLQTFIEVGQALAEIRDSRLFADTHGTFIEYCRDRWDLSTSRASRLISASETVSALPIGNTPVPLPTNEGQARELAGLDPDVAVDVMHRAHEATGGQLTAAAIKDARTEIEDEKEINEHFRHVCAMVLAAEEEVADTLWYVAASSMSNAVTGQEIADIVTTWRTETSQDYPGGIALGRTLDRFIEWVTAPATEEEWRDPNCTPLKEREGGEEWLHANLRRPLDDWKKFWDLGDEGGESA